MAPLFPQTPNISNIRNQFSNPYQNTQVPGMSINIPTMLQQTNRTPNPQLVGVHGFDSVKQFPTNPGETISLHDLDANFEYIVDTDINNHPSYKILKFSQISEEEYREEYSKIVNKDTVTLTSEEYNTLVKRLERVEKELKSNGKHSIRYQKSNPNSDYRSNDEFTAKTTTRPENTGNVSEVKEQQ